MKPQAEAKESVQRQTNGAGATSLEPMTIESDDDDDDDEPEIGTLQPSDGGLEFEDQAQEFDPSTPVAPIIQTLNLCLEAQVLHLSFLQLPTNLGQSFVGSFPPMLFEKLLVAVACSDCSVRLLSMYFRAPYCSFRAGFSVLEQFFSLICSSAMSYSLAPTWEWKC